MSCYSVMRLALLEDGVEAENGEIRLSRDVIAIVDCVLANEPRAILYPTALLVRSRIEGYLGAKSGHVVCASPSGFARCNIWAFAAALR
jgi:hypothetical protein